MSLSNGQATPVDELPSPEPVALDELANEVPTARQVDGEWIVGAMPSPDLVTRFVDTLTLATKTPILFGPHAVDDPTLKHNDQRAFNTWWRSYQASDAPIDGWAGGLDESEQLLLDYACKTLSSVHIDNLIQRLKTDVFPADWGSSVGQFRSTADRLFDRLRLNYLTAPASLPPLDPSEFPLPWRLAGWATHDGVAMGPQTTIFGRRAELNAFYALDGKLTVTGTPLGTLVGLTEQPDAFAFPLAWSEAVHSGLAPGLQAKLPADLQQRLASFADDVKAGVKALDKTTFWARLIGALSIPLTNVGGVAAIWLAGLPSSLADAIDHWPAALKRAADNDAYLNDVAYELLHMLRVTDYDGVFEKKIEDALGTENYVLFIGLWPDQVADIEHALRPSTTSGFKPMILLGNVFADYAHHHFGKNPFQVGSRHTQQVVPYQALANELWTRWWNDTQPTLDLAYVLDTAGIVVEQLLHLDDALLAVNSLAAGEGPVASSLRASLDSQDIGSLSDGLGGASPSAMLRFAFRQLWTDHFLDWVEKEQDLADTTGTDRIRTADLYPVFNWMASSNKRDQIDAALGPMLEVTPDNAGPLYGAYRTFAGLWAYGTRPLSMRGWMLPNAAPADRGAFGRIITALTGPGIGTITLSDIGAVRDWLQSARTSRIGNLQNQLEPVWDHPQDPPVHIPDDLGGLDEVGHEMSDSGGPAPQQPVIVKNPAQKPITQKPSTAKKAAGARSAAKSRPRGKSKRR